MRRGQKPKFYHSVVKLIVCYGMAICVMIACVFLFCSFNWKVEAESYSFTQSSRKIQNPNRGFYYIYKFWITDGETDYMQDVAKKYREDAGTSLTLVEINLQNYREGEISDKGLANIEALFRALETIDKQFIVRFLYDWDGENETYEPESLDIILNHMKQLESVLRGHSRQIFAVQGLFIGNWGEMNGTKYVSPEELQSLTLQLEQVTETSTYLSVRTPSQWRNITGIVSPAPQTLAGSSLGMRLGLFNDGILGNETDYGTYGTKDLPEIGPFTGWLRQDELAFQDNLCRLVPNGGEVIRNNPYNDFSNAVRDLSRMHITYLNEDYDKEVFAKWAKETVTEEGCFSGMDGYSYIERRLGYRLYIDNVLLDPDDSGRNVSVDITLKNAGFAPIYKDTESKLLLYSEEKSELFTYDVLGNLSALAGGAEADVPLALHLDIPVKDLSRTRYTVYFLIKDIDSGKYIVLANEQMAELMGYPVGTIEIM